MTTDTALIEKREELKRRLAAGEYKTLVDVFLAWTNRVIQKITRRTKPLPLWLITVILSLAVSLIYLAVLYITGDLTAITTFKYFDGLGLEYGLAVLWTISNNFYLIAGSVVINRYIGRIFVLWIDDMLDATESVASLDEFEDWLRKTCNQRLHLLVLIFGSLLGGLYRAAYASARLGVFVGYGFTFTFIANGLYSNTILYLFLMVVFLSARLRRYDLKLFAADPGSSELISHLSGILSFIVYFVAAILAIGMLEFALGGFSDAEILISFFLWSPIIAMFILNQTSLSSIIRRAKWKTLNEIQARVEKLHASEKLGEKDTMEAINRLMDYYDRIKSTRNSRVDLGAVLNLINSLLLPLLALALGNIDKILALFK